MQATQTIHRVISTRSSNDIALDELRRKRNRINCMDKKPRKQISRTVNQFPVIVQEDVTGGYWVSCPVFQGCYSQGETLDEALENIKDAIALSREEENERDVQGDVSLHFVRV